VVMDGGRRQMLLKLVDQAQRPPVIIDRTGVDDFPTDLSCLCTLFHINKPDEGFKVVLEIVAMACCAVLVFDNGGNLLGRIVGQSVEEV